MWDEWQNIEFSDILLDGTRNGVYKKKEFHGSGTKIVNMGELFANPRLFDIPMKRVELSESELEKSLLQPGDLLFARRSLIAKGAGKCSIVMEITEPTTFESSIIRARPNPEKANSLFLYYLFNSPQGRYLLGTILRQVAVSGITGSDLVQLRISLPSLREQKAIACILGALDDKIELNRRMNRTLEAMARAIFKSWFVDFDPIQAKVNGGQPPGLAPHIADLFPGSFEDSELGEIPSGWDVQSFADTVDIIGGGTPKTSVAEYWNGEIPWFSVVDAPVNNGVWVIDTQKKITQAGVDNSSAQILPQGTTIISARGTVGRVVIVGKPMAMNQSCYGLKGKVDKHGFYTYFSTLNLVKDLQQRAHGSVFSTITRDTLKSVTVVMPSSKLIQSFEFVVSPLLNQMRSNLFQSQNLAAVRDTLLPRLISGDLRVPDAERIVGRCI